MRKFEEVMAQHSDAELLEIAASTEDDYQAEALEAARAELAKRNLTPLQRQAADEELEAKAADKRVDAESPLGARAIVPLLFPGFGYLLVASALRKQGKTRQAKEMKFYGWLGIGIWGGLVLLVMLWLVFVRVILGVF